MNVTLGTGGTVQHGLVILTNVQGEALVHGETITGGTSSNTAVIQGDSAGWKGARHFEFSAVKQIGQLGLTQQIQNCQIRMVKI